MSATTGKAITEFQIVFICNTRVIIVIVTAGILFFNVLRELRGEHVLFLGCRWTQLEAILNSVERWWGWRKSDEIIHLRTLPIDIGSRPYFSSNGKANLVDLFPPQAPSLVEARIELVIIKQ